MFVDLGRTFAEFETLRREIDNVFNHHSRFARGDQRFPLINIYDHAEKLEIVAEVPGVAMDDLDITYVEGVLKLSGERKLPEGFDSNTTTLRQERSSGKFEKQYRIPLKIDADKITASLKDGILNIVLPKAEEAKPRKIEIQA